MAKFRFEFLLQLAVDEREEAAKALQLAQSDWLAARAKLEQIDDYRNEYRQRLTSGGQQGMTITQWSYGVRISRSPSTPISVVSVMVVAPSVPPDMVYVVVIFGAALDVPIVAIASLLALRVLEIPLLTALTKFCQNAAPVPVILSNTSGV